MNHFHSLVACANLVIFQAACAGGTPAGLVVGWGNNLSVSNPGVPFYGWAVPAEVTNCTLVSQPALGHGPLLTNAIAVACGLSHALALLVDGRVAGWGWNGMGQAVGPETVPMPRWSASGQFLGREILPGKTNGMVRIYGRLLSNVVAIAAGRTHSLALRSNGTVAAWGGMDTPRGYEVPKTVLSNVVAITAGEASNLALSTPLHKFAHVFQAARAIGWDGRWSRWTSLFSSSRVNFHSKGLAIAS